MVNLLSNPEHLPAPEVKFPAASLNSYCGFWRGRREEIRTTFGEEGWGVAKGVNSGVKSG